MKHDFPFVTVDSNSVCDICHLARHRKLPYKLSINKATSCGELIHFDIWGPNSVHSINGHRYFLTAIDDYSRFTWVILLKAKSEVSILVQNFVKMIETQFNTCVKTIRTDNGPEFLIPDFYSSKGIVHQTSCVETPQQNGRVERKHQHLLNVGRSLLYQSKLPKQFWSYAVVHAAFIINRVNTLLLASKSPYHLLYNKPPDLSELKVFGSLCYASTLHVHRTKLDPRARKCIFLGYRPGMKGVVLFDMHDKKIFVSRDVIHHDHILPYQPNPNTIQWTYHTSPSTTISPPSTTTPSPGQFHPPVITIQPATEDDLDNQNSMPSSPDNQVTLDQPDTELTPTSPSIFHSQFSQMKQSVMC
jgi:hypothetical protein